MLIIQQRGWKLMFWDLEEEARIRGVEGISKNQGKERG